MGIDALSGPPDIVRHHKTIALVGLHKVMRHLPKKIQFNT
jgi:hypothetical protein